MNFDFRVFHLQEKQFGVRADLDDHRIDYSFAGGYVDLAFAIKHPEYYVVQQWIGLVDNNGKRIFEGDVVFRHGEKQIVEYFSGDGFDFQGFAIDQVFGKWEIVGNILENPELLSKVQA